MMVDNWQWYVGRSKSSDEFDSTGWSVSLSFSILSTNRNVFSCLSVRGWWPTIGPIVFAILLRLAQLMHWAWNVGISFRRNWGLVEEAGDFGNQSRSQIVESNQKKSGTELREQLYAHGFLVKPKVLDTKPLLELSLWLYRRSFRRWNEIRRLMSLTIMMLTTTSHG